jgi:hypothetical protein
VAVADNLHNVLSRRRDRRSAHRLSTEGRCRLEIVTPSVSNSASSVRKWARSRCERDVILRTICMVTRLSLTTIISRERTKLANACRPCIVARSSSSLMLEPPFTASKTPLTGVVPSHTALHQRMLASTNMATNGAGQTSRPTREFELRLANHCRSRRPAWLIVGCRAVCALFGAPIFRSLRQAWYMRRQVSGRPSGAPLPGLASQLRQFLWPARHRNRVEKLSQEQASVHAREPRRVSEPRETS